ncbi:hypothetical protein KC333_g139 [Hortaea werneckii]|nr:hypothetical protein KC333_g139 [Hortaea werneckii]
MELRPSSPPATEFVISLLRRRCAQVSLVACASADAIGTHVATFSHARLAAIVVYGNSPSEAFRYPRGSESRPEHLKPPSSTSPALAPTRRPDQSVCRPGSQPSQPSSSDPHFHSSRAAAPASSSTASSQCRGDTSQQLDGHCQGPCCSSSFTRCKSGAEKRFERLFGESIARLFRTSAALMPPSDSGISARLAPAMRSSARRSFSEAASAAA